LKIQKIVREAAGVSERTVKWRLNERTVSAKFSSYTTAYKEEFRVSRSWLKQFQQCRYLNCYITEQKWPSLKQIHTKAVVSVNSETSVCFEKNHSFRFETENKTRKKESL
jgi:hypothetical protein